MEKKPTPEEILAKEINKLHQVNQPYFDFENDIYDGNAMPIIKAMQEYAEAYHKEKLREELIRFQIWHEDKLFKCHALEMAVEHNVDEYLKTKE